MPVRPPPRWSTGLREVAPDTFAYLQHDGSWGISNAGFLAGDEGLLVIDATMVASMAQAFIEQIRRVSDKPFRHLINTHSHPDHTGGNRLFAGAEIIAHRICREEMARQAEPRAGGESRPGPLAAIPRTPALQRMFDLVAADSGRHIPLPTLTYDDRLTLHYGQTEVELLYYGPAHTFGDTLVYFPQSKVLFAGDVAFFYAMPLVTGKVGGWLKVIDRIRELDVETIVPGHGPVGGRQELEDEREYFEFLMDQSRRCFERGLAPEEAAKEIDLGPYREWPEAERFAANVIVAYRELRGEI
ncbi:MAG TPA: MBL fold metallo-hydrolase [Dehalococcoidia bacterium]|nr:MBL fold metallo-hydrolase [Dehalococcoidia bacterium]